MSKKKSIERDPEAPNHEWFWKNRHKVWSVPGCEDVYIEPWPPHNKSNKEKQSESKK